MVGCRRLGTASAIFAGSGCCESTVRTGTRSASNAASIRAYVVQDEAVSEYSNYSIVTFYSVDGRVMGDR